MEIFKNYVRLDQRLYLSCKRHIPKHRRIMLIEHLIDSVVADCAFPDKLLEHDMLFEPGNEYEKKLWESCRAFAKEDMNNLLRYSAGGKKSAEVRKQKRAEGIMAQPVSDKDLPPVKPRITKEKFIEWANQMNDFVGMGGFANTTEQAEAFWNHFEAQGWRRKNGMPIINTQPLYKIWVSKDKATQEEDLPAPIVCD